MTKTRQIKSLQNARVKAVTFFTAIIDGVPSAGRVQIENQGGTNYYYLCQSQKDGSSPSNGMFKFKYGWCIGANGRVNRDGGDVVNFKITKTLHKVVKPSIVRLNKNYKAVVFKDFVMVGCQRIEADTVRKLAKALGK